MTHHTDTVVIGAGIAGLAAARTLHDAGGAVVVLEARHRLGGRIHTDRALGFPVELGAHWIHGAYRNPIAALARRWRLRTAPTTHPFIALPTAAEVPALLEQAFPCLLARAQELAWHQERDLPLGEALQRLVAGCPSQLRSVRLGLDWLSLVMGTDAACLSARHWDQDLDLPGPDLVLLDGYDALVQRLARGLEVRLGEAVRQVEWTPEGVWVESTQATYRAAAAIVTLPLGVLKAGSVRFVPPLPARQQRAIARLGMGVLDKVVLVFARPCWPAAGEHLANPDRRPGELAGFSSLLPHLGAPVLVGWVAGRQAQALEDADDAEAVAWAMRTLRRLLGPGLPDPVHTRVTRWGSDPYARGAYSHLPAGACGADYDALAVPVSPRLHLAGEATHRRYPSTVHGAYLSGRRAARRVLRLVRPH
ncbi:MAG: amine oxidase [Candidatus Tectimicrobiota bacterium]|nr:MAG: amine oxidase [Candidatus Tectomicrobia bacterium]